MHKNIWLIIFFSALLWSAIHPKEYFTWFLEVFPALIGFIILVLSRKSFPLTPLLYWLILFHSIVLMIGGHYTYAEEPLFDWLKDTFDLSRNNYDKVGHFTQGFVPAIIARELFIRKNIVNGLWWRRYLVVSVCLAFSAFYELIEWAVAVLSGDDAVAFLGTQGYIWDTQSDMGWALFGSITALIVLSHLHDKQIKTLTHQA
jgi:putative membrane protein